jgi:RNA polymerase sigma factor (sigma-70 family)
MTGEGNGEHDRARRFRDAALPYLDDVYSLARYLMRNPADAEDAAQECYVRALRHFDSYRGPAMKPWLLTILRNVCNAEFARRRKQETPTDFSEHETAAEERFRSRFARPSYCERSMTCRITRSPRSPACRWER